MKSEENIQALKKRIKELEKENLDLKKKKDVFFTDKKTVKVPKNIEPLFDSASEVVKKYFQSFTADPGLSKIEVNGQRYILMRAESLANDFLNNIVRLYSDLPANESLKIGRNLLFDFAHLIGIEDAKNFHKKMKLKDPLSKLSAGPVHFAYTGWASVDILPESNPSPDNDFYIKYHHPYSFEADSWIQSKQKTNFPVCSMNAGYSSGWCEQSYGFELTSVEITCRAKGDKNCTFIMAPPNRIAEYLDKENLKYKQVKKYDIPLFFERKKSEEVIKTALKEKETLLREIHHRVKNNLQIISSLLKLHAEQANDVKFSNLVDESQHRIISMSLIHEMLYANSDLSKINLTIYAKFLFEKLQSSYSNLNIKLIVIVPKDFCFEIDKMIPIGLIMNEVFSNSFKYAFQQDKGEITIAIKNDSLILSDNGIGISKKILKNNSTSFGLQLIELLAEQIDAKQIIRHINGTSFEFKFKDGLQQKTKK
ncbi:MAG: histidine kinase dimerization/phosphoacceptor domain -containing protein [Bacteroidota bacterium]